ncbi:hypothetical protein FRB98_003967, partial [Tulasnella sp. 332]
MDHSATVSPAATITCIEQEEREQRERMGITDNPEDPYNWPSWKKHALLFQVGFHAMMGPFVAAAVIPAFGSFAEEYGISITQASYFVSVQIIFIGVAPLFWAPVANRIGRRPVYLISTLGAAAYGSMMTTRVFAAIMISPPQAIASSTIGEMFYEHEEGSKMGIWMLFVTLGPPVAPLIFGFVVQRTSWHWIFWSMSIALLLEFVLYFFIGHETLFDRSHDLEKVKSPDTIHPTSSWLEMHLHFPRQSNAKWSHALIEMFTPFKMFTRLPVFLPSFAYTVLFMYSNVLLTVEIPALLGVRYHLGPQATGLQFIAPIVGCMLGEPVGGYGSDKFMERRHKQGKRDPEARLWFALPGFLFGVVGLIIFGVQLQNTQAAGVWNITPDIGTAITFFGLQIVSTVAVTYAVESQPIALAQDASLFIMAMRQTCAFTGPFYFNKQYAAMGPAKATGLLAGIVGAASLLVVATIAYGKQWRSKQQGLAG